MEFGSIGNLQLSHFKFICQYIFLLIRREEWMGLKSDGIKEDNQKVK